jgi:hypothetical protein
MDIVKTLAEEIKRTGERYTTFVHLFNERSQLYGVLITLLKSLDKQQFVITQEDMETARKYLVTFIPEDDRFMVKLSKAEEHETGQESS